MLVTHGNRKLAKDTLIFNITSATNCKSRELGLCQIPDRCYALRDEKRWLGEKGTLQFRERQTIEWDSKIPMELAIGLSYEIARHYKPMIKYIRFSEAGDFRDQNDVNKLIDLANIIKSIRPYIIFYGYTARSDLDFSNRPDNLIVNGSGFMIDNSFTVINKEDKDKYPLICPMDCHNCDLCKETMFNNIKIPIH